jgi:hypothetical protein
MIGVSGIAIKFSLGLIDQVEKIRNFFLKKNSSYIYIYIKTLIIYARLPGFWVNLIDCAAFIGSIANMSFS